MCDVDVYVVVEVVRFVAVLYEYIELDFEYMNFVIAFIMDKILLICIVVVKVMKILMYMFIEMYCKV